MASYNRIILVGNLTRDPELSFTPNDVAVCKFSIATEYKYKDKKEVCYVGCVLFAKSAETFNQYMKKGSQVLVEGRLKLEQWEKDGRKLSKHSVVCSSFTFLGSKADSGTDAQAPADDDIPF